MEHNIKVVFYYGNQSYKTSITSSADLNLKNSVIDCAAEAVKEYIRVNNLKCENAHPYNISIYIDRELFTNLVDFTIID